MASTSSPDVGFSHSLHTLYQRYKAGTTVIIDWLIKHGSPKPTINVLPPTNLLPVRRILDLAQTAAQRKRSPSAELRITFKSVLVHRRLLTKYYEEHHDGVEEVKDSTDRHQFFNDTLAQAYDTLFPTTAIMDPKSRKLGTAESTQHTDKAFAHRNRFTALSDLIEQEPDFDLEYVAPLAHATSPTVRSKIEDDPLEMLIAAHAYILEVECVINLAIGAWARAARKEVPIPLVGVLTNFAYQQIRYLAAEYGPQFSYHEGLLVCNYFTKDIATISKRVARQSAQVQSEKSAGVRHFRGFSEHQYLYWAPPYIQGLLSNQSHENKQWLEEKDDCKLQDIFPAPEVEAFIEGEFRLEFPATVDNVAVSGQPAIGQSVAPEQVKDIFEKRFRGEIYALISTWSSVLRISRIDILRNKNALLSTIRPPQAGAFRPPTALDIEGEVFMFQPAESVPMLVELEQLVRNPEKPIGSQLIFGITMLMESTRTFLWSGETISPVNCRIRALALAGEVHKALATVREVEKDKIMRSAHHESELVVFINNMCDLLQQYRSMRRFSLYHQSPWVAGSDMAAILGNAQILGLFLLRNQGIFGSFLHLYNMLAGVGTVDRIEPLEALCDLFKEEVFLGNRPKKNYAAVLFRFNGGPATLTEDLRRPSKTRAVNMHKKTESRLEPLRISMFINQFFCGSRLDDFQVGKFSASLKIKSSRKSSNIGKFQDVFLRFSEYPKVFNCMEELLKEDFAGSLPIASLNCFKAYRLCLEVWKEISIECSAVGEVSEGFTEWSGLDPQEVMGNIHTGMIWHISTAKMIDLRMGTSKGIVNFDNPKPLQVMSAAITKIWGGKKTDEFVWKEV